MEIVAFVKEEQIDPIYFDSSYFALPEKDSEKAYALLLKALEDRKRVAIATITMHQREYTVFIRPHEHGLTVHTMFFENEIRDVEGYGKTDEHTHLKPQEIKLAEQLVETLSEDFDPSKYHDTFQQNLKALIESKQKGRTFVEEPKPGRRVIGRRGIINAVFPSLPQEDEGLVSAGAENFDQTLMREEQTFD